MSFNRAGKKPIEIDVEVPPTFSKFMEGLMFRKHLGDKQGMIFRWSQDGGRSFWMENTYIPLDIIYVNAANKVVSIRQAQPLDLNGVPSDWPARYAIEVQQGWCAKNGVKVGDEAVLPEFPAGSYEASDAKNFGASAEEVQAAVDDGVYDPSKRE